MSDAMTAETVLHDAEPSPHALLFDLATRAVAARCLHVIAAIGVADVLGPDGDDVRTLAKRSSSVKACSPREATDRT